MTKEDIEKMRAVDSELVAKLEQGITLKTPKFIELFHMYQQLDNQSKIKFIELIENSLNDE